MVRCLVCGEIFDSSIEICPVCGVGKENFVPYEEKDKSYKNNTKEIYVVLGNGAAGISAATAIRERDETGTIIMVSNESVLSYNRPMLTKSLSTQIRADLIAIQDEKWYIQHNITNMLGTNVTKINTQEKVVIFSDGNSLKYDKCIYALGSECFIPPIPGRDKSEVIAIRRITDVEKINALLPKVENVVVIGGGVLGLEAAWEMNNANCMVTVLEVADKLMGRQLDTDAGKMLGEIIESVGINFRLNAKVSEISGQDTVTGVKLDSGEFYPAELVIISSGICANSAIAKDAGITVERGVVVNAKMETNVNHVYACGDCAEYNGINYAIWPQALEMGKVAGANATGEALTYDIVPAALSFNGMNTSLYAIGDNGKNPNLQYKTVDLSDSAKKTYEKYYFADNILVGAILIGDTSKLVEITEAVKDKQLFNKMF